uniref:Glycosylated lysosomal membrane protein n=1 Tax=Varanus komodoensis TaxID=61221 RepID=A0A8D2JFR9_VARKO
QPHPVSVLLFGVYLEYNPGWNSSAGNLLHVRAVGLEDTIHYIWSTIGAPTVLLVYTGSTNSALHVNWTALLSPSPSGAIRVEPATSILYSTAVFEYNGTKTSDLSKVDAGDFYPTYDLARFTWDSLDGRLNKSTLTATFQGVSSDPGTAFWNGSISFQVTAYKESGRDASLPRLLHTANSSKVEFVMSGVSPRGNHSRFALEVVTVEERGWRRQLRAVSSIDDEYSPTIFEVALRARPVSPGHLGAARGQPGCLARSRPVVGPLPQPCPAAAPRAHLTAAPPHTHTDGAAGF